ncbi:MAG: UDP-2,3-diacylglucosamine diphosphatase, partial [Gammaproteobacteria bacterium]|nr:UDP-2,3-diacylglucosamine diphosphatase [Gammaproteobacteria bacterium]
MTTLFISDLHLEAERPDIGEQFLNFLKTEAADAEALYILGDLFEAWVGDDDPNTHYHVVKMALRKLVDKGVPAYFMHGNRDFMIGERFANETGVKILPDPFRVNLYGQKTLLSHGDKFCTDDVQYQQIRKMTRDPAWQAKMLAKPLKERIAIAEEARRQSLEQTINLTMDIMDVNQEAVRQTIIKHHVDILLHGHTHRPDVHTVDLGGRKAKRV